MRASTSPSSLGEFSLEASFESRAASPPCSALRRRQDLNDQTSSQAAAPDRGTIALDGDVLDGHFDDGSSAAHRRRHRMYLGCAAGFRISMSGKISITGRRMNTPRRGSRASTPRHRAARYGHLRDAQPGQLSAATPDAWRSRALCRSHGCLCGRADSRPRPRREPQGRDPALSALGCATKPYRWSMSPRARQSCARIATQM